MRPSNMAQGGNPPIDDPSPSEEEIERARHRSLVRSSPDAIVQANTEGKIVGWNRGAEEMFGYDAEEVQGQPLTTIMPERYRSMHREGVERFLATQEGKILGRTLELQGLARDGTEFPVELTVDTFTVGDARFFSGIVRDITQRKRSEAIAQMFSRIAVAANQADAIEDAMDTAVEAVCEQTGWPIGHAYLTDAEDPDLLVPLDSWHIEEPGSFETLYETTMQTPFESGAGLPGRVLATGEPAWIEDVHEDPNFPRAEQATEIGVHGAFAFPVLVGDEVVGVLEFYATDPEIPDEELIEVVEPIGIQLGRVVERIRSRRQLEAREHELQQQTKQLERSRENWREFGYAISHDLKEPVRTIASHLQLLDRRNVDDLDEDVREAMDYAIEGARRLHERIEDLLDYTRVDTQGDPMQTVDLETIVRDVRKDLAEHIDREDAEIEVGELPTVRADPGQVRRLLQNLLSNAVKFGDDASQTPTRVHAEPVDGDRVRILVEDDGPGIPKDKQQEIFQMFNRGNQGDETAGQGTGLAIARRIANRHGGRLDVESTPGEGATFWFTLERADE